MTGLPPPDWQIIDNALVVPPTGSGRPRHGVFDADERFVPMSATRLSHGKPNPQPTRPTDPIETIGGTHVYAGLGRMHFGHFLLESVTRAWALPQIDEDVQSVVFASMPQGDLRKALEGTLGGLYQALCAPHPPMVLKKPARFDRLIVPGQGFGHGAWITGTDEFRRHIRAALSQDCARSIDRLYISRRKLGAPRQRVDQEDALETHLHQAGYTIFHPESADITQQLSTYQASRTIIGGDGSAFHLAAMVAEPDQKIGVILRRNRPEMLDLLSRQFQAFAGMTPDTFDPLLPLEDQRALVPEGANAPSPIDLAALLADLKTKGYL